MSTRKSLRKLALTTNGLRTTTFLANAAVTSSYNLTLPSTVPSIAGQSLISDTLGNLSWGSTSATVSTYTGTVNPVTVATTVTGLLFTVPSTSISVYVAINATTNIYAVYSLYAYQKGSATSWGLAYQINGDTDDDPGINFSITSTGQVQYVLGTVTGFTSVVMMWTLGTSVSNILTSLALSSTLNVGGASTFTAGIQGTSLALSSTLTVGGLATLAATSGLSLVLGNASASGSISSTVGSFLSLQSQIYTDTLTAASSTAAGNFSGTYLGIPTIAATNTSVTTGIASTLTVAGPPTAGTNETITNAYALNVASGLSYFGGNVYVNASFIRNVAREFCGRYYLMSNWTPATGWNYLPTTGIIGVATDIPPAVNATVNATNTGTSVNYNPSTGLIFLPTAGKWTFNVWACYLPNCSGTNSYEFRLCTYSVPAWPAAGSGAKTYGTGQTAGSLSGSSAAQLATSTLVTVNEGGLFYSGIFPANTLIALIVYSGSAVTFNVYGLYFEAKMDYALQ